MSKKALMICSNYWTSPSRVGSHHIARNLVDMGWAVAYISAPISPLHIMGRTDLRQRFTLYKGGGKPFLNGRLWAYVPGAVLVPYDLPFLRSQWILRKWINLTIPNVVKKVERNGFGDVNLLYIESLIQPLWIDAINYEKSILRVTDHFASLETLSKAALLNQDQLAQRVDLVTYSAKSLEGYVAALHPKGMLHLPNGCNFSHFENRDLKPPIEYINIPKPIVIYVGAMDYWFDYGLVEYAAIRLPKVSFVLVGPEGMARERLKNLPNLYLLGRRTYSDLPAYLNYADVGIIPFDVGRYPSLVNHIHPLKLYEYMACGLPVVAPDWEELRNLGSSAILCRNATDFVDGITQAILEPGVPDERIRYAKNADWKNRVSTLIEKVGLC